MFENFYDNLKRQQDKDRAEEGFTLVELMVVIVIIGLLATVVVMNVLPSQDRAMVEKARADISVLEQALELYRMDLMSYPTTQEGLDALLTRPSGLRQADHYRSGGYIKRLPLDPWRNPYQFLYPGEKGIMDIYSLGADGKTGGEGKDKDIGNWKDD